MGGTVLSDDGVDDLEWAVVESEDMDELKQIMECPYGSPAYCSS